MQSYSQPTTSVTDCSSETKSILSDLFNILHLFDGMPISYIVAWLSVAKHPNEATQFYAKVCGTSDGAMSKVLNALGDLALDRTKPGYKLLESRPGFDRRYTLHRLSPSGHALALRIARMIGGGM